VLGLTFGWKAAAEIGVTGAVLVILAWQSPKIIDSCSRFTKVILKHQREKHRIPKKVKDKKTNLAKKIEARTKGKKKP
jgi:hypothetical protein